MQPYYDPGRYVGTIQNHGLGRSKDKGTPFVWLTVRVDGFDGAEEQFGESLKQERTIYLYLTEKTHERTRESLEAVGWNGADWQDLQNVSGMLGGNQIVIRCQHEEYQGKRREKWDVPGGAFTPEPLDDKTLRGLNAMFGKSGNTKPKPKPAAKPKTESLDDANRRFQETNAADIPF